jgi:uncharacterized protein YciI
MTQNLEITDEFIQQTVASGKRYCIFLYKAGPHRDQPPAEADEIQMEHLRYLFRLRAEGKLVINGPVTDETELKGVGIFNTADTEEVKNLLAADPAVKAGRLIYEIYPWFSIPGDCLP